MAKKGRDENKFSSSAMRRKGKAAKRRKPEKIDVNDYEEGGLTLVEGRKKGRKRRSIIRVFLRLAIVAVLVVGGIQLWRNWESIAPDSFVVWVNEKMSGGQSGDGFPVELTGSSVKNMISARDGLIVLTDSAVVMYNHNGGEIFRRQHGFAKPQVKTAGKWILLLENDGKRFRLETRGETFVEHATESKIIGGTVDSNGNYIIITESAEDYFSEVRLYNNKGELKFEWFSSKILVSDVSLSADGKHFAAAGFNAENGVMNSKVLVFNLSEKEPTEVYSAADDMIFAVDFYAGGNIFALSGSSAITLNVEGTLQVKYSFEGQEIIGCSSGENRSSVVLKDSALAGGGNLVGLTETGDVEFTQSFSGEFRDVYCSNDQTILLSAKQALLFDVEGKSKMTEVKADCRLVASFGSRYMVLGLSDLEEIEFK